MAKYRKRQSVMVEAVQWYGENLEEIQQLSEKTRLSWSDDWRLLFIHTTEGRLAANLGDWIIRGESGELYPCKPDIFSTTYVPIDDDDEEEAGSEPTNRVQELLRLRLEEIEAEKDWLRIGDRPGEPGLIEKRMLRTRFSVESDEEVSVRFEVKEGEDDLSLVVAIVGRMAAMNKYMGVKVYLGDGKTLWWPLELGCGEEALSADQMLEIEAVSLVAKSGAERSVCLAF